MEAHAVFCKELPYQLALTTPGIKPVFAISRKHSLESLNFFKTPRERPVSWHRLQRRTGEELRDILFKVTLAALRSSSLLSMSMMIFFRFWRLSHFSCTRRSRFFCFAIQVFVIFLLLLFTSRTFLSLLAVWVRFVDHINASLTAHNFIPFRRVGFDRSSDFHVYLKKEN